jgi:hypothetical protein
LQRERDNLTAQVKAATQQYRNERAKREEVEEKLGELEATVADLRAQLTVRDVTPCEKALWDSPIRPPSTALTAILPSQNMTAPDQSEMSIADDQYDHPIYRNLDIAPERIAKIEQACCLKPFSSRGGREGAIAASNLWAEFLYAWQKLGCHPPPDLHEKPRRYWLDQEGKKPTEISGTNFRGKQA